MRKEVLFAIIFGIVLGGIILFGIRLANSSVENLTPPKETATASAEPTITKSKKELEIISPQNHSVLSEKTITITGQTSPNTSLAITSESDDIILESSPVGTFSAEINLISGENTITVTALLADQKTVFQTLTIIQSNSLPE